MTVELQVAQTVRHAESAAARQAGLPVRRKIGASARIQLSLFHYFHPLYFYYYFFFFIQMHKAASGSPTVAKKQRLKNPKKKRKKN